MGNFTFLESRWKDLEKLGSLSEKYVYADPNASLIKQGMLAELMVKYMLAYDGLKEPEYDNTHAMRIRILKRNGLLPKQIDNILYILRKDRNEAAHNVSDEQERAINNLKLCYELCVWFMQIYGDYKYKALPYQIPEDKDVSVLELQRENQKLDARNKALQFELQTLQEKSKSDERRNKYAHKKAQNIILTEAQTRELIDEQLRRCGWEADTWNIRYSKGARPEKGKNKAIAEWPTNSSTGSRGYADYALFIGEKLVGVVEAKRKHVNVLSALDNQSKEYAKQIKEEHQNYVIKKYDEYYVPFLFATNGRPYAKQFEEVSGIWFLDVRYPFSAPKALSGWPTPQSMELDLERDIEEADRKLMNTGYELLQDENGLGLRDYQIDAIKAVENSLLQHKDRMLLAMATGTGKTRTILGLIYRFLTVKRFKRILYLVDRRTLGDQTKDTFGDVRLEGLKSLDKIYGVKALSDKEFESDTRVHIATVQSLVKRILYNESENDLGVSDYDCIIVDESHRGYILDKEMGEDEVLYRNQDDYRSKYRAVIDYFDAVKIGITATPALHTIEIFGKPVYTYDYTTAVVDGWLVDHDAPHKIGTLLTDTGITFKAGTSVPIYDPETGEITNSDELEDDLLFDVDDFNKRVIDKNTTRAILEELSKYIDPNEQGKTLIFAVNDMHADTITQILKEIYTAQGISEQAILKITGSIENGNHDKIKETIRRFKNETYPNIVVTVDLLTTGIDIEKIVNLVFMRRVRSRILFEQMLGRATRLCDEIGKTHFDIYDAVGVYDTLLPVSTMKPVVVNPEQPFDVLIEGLEHLETQKAKERQIKTILAKLQRNRKRMSSENKEQFAALTEGETPENIVVKLRSMSVEEAVQMIQKYKEAFSYVQGEHHSRPIFISDEEDYVVSHTRGYGATGRPEDYLKEFRDFVDTHINEVAALNIVATRPNELTREELRELTILLKRHNFSETELKSAWKNMTNQEVAADIISFIRQKSIGDALIGRDERIKKAIDKTKEAHPEMTKLQINWLDRIQSYLLQEAILNRESFDAPQFKNKGGYNAVNKAFGEKLDDLIDEINNHMYSA